VTGLTTSVPADDAAPPIITTTPPPTLPPAPTARPAPVGSPGWTPDPPTEEQITALLAQPRGEPCDTPGPVYWPPDSGRAELVFVCAEVLPGLDFLRIGSGGYYTTLDHPPAGGYRCDEVGDYRVGDYVIDRWWGHQTVHRCIEIAPGVGVFQMAELPEPGTSPTPARPLFEAPPSGTPTPTPVSVS
jgi:hypothetical protein